jgi:hypothetical protein
VIRPNDGTLGIIMRRLVYSYLIPSLHSLLISLFTHCLDYSLPRLLTASTTHCLVCSLPRLLTASTTHCLVYSLPRLLIASFPLPRSIPLMRSSPHPLILVKSIPDQRPHCYKLRRKISYNHVKSRSKQNSLAVRGA